MPQLLTQDSARSFPEFVARVRQQVEARLGRWLDARVGEAAIHGADVALVADGIRELTMRGGKRLRAALLAAAFEACGGGETQAPGGAQALGEAYRVERVERVEIVSPVGAALELFQTYLLAHDDLMDRDDVRRGGPSLPALMRERFGSDRMEAMSILAGDLAGAWSQRLFFEAELPPERLRLAAREFARVHGDVVAGQILDVCGASRDAFAVEAMHALKTASYSVRGPVVIGAHLAGASDEQTATLVAFAEPLGIAFQLRDDVLGTFGNPDAMGKSAGSDLREGKRTALVVEALRAGEADAKTAATLGRVLGRRDASDSDVTAAMACIESCGARARVEARIVELARQSRASLDRGVMAPGGRALLEGAIDTLTERRS